MSIAGQLEHLPEPQRFDSFPPFAIRLSDAIVGDTGVGVLSFACEDSTDGAWAWMSSGYASELSR